jgi:hypothetical protein
METEDLVYRDDMDSTRLQKTCRRCGKVFDIPWSEQFQRYAEANGLEFAHCFERESMEAPERGDKAECAFCDAEYYLLSADQPDDMCPRCTQRADR